MSTRKKINLGDTIIVFEGDTLVNHKEFQAKHTFGLNCSVPLCNGGATRVSKAGLLFCASCMLDLGKVNKMNLKCGLIGLIYMALITALGRKNANQMKAAELLKVSPRRINYLISEAGIKSKKWKKNAPKVGSNYTKDHKLRVMA